jgi:hypothetical protein
MTIVQVECWPRNEFAGQVQAIIENAGFKVKSFDSVFLIEQTVYGSEPISRWTFEADSPRLSAVLGQLANADAVLVL